MQMKNPRIPRTPRIHRWVVAFLIVALTLGGGGDVASAGEPSPTPPAASPTVDTVADGLILTWQAPLPDLTRRADGTVAVSLPGYAQSDTPGAPQLPLTSQLVVLPPGARPTVEIIQTEEVDLPLPGPLHRAPRPSGVQRDEAGTVIGGAFAESAETPCLAVNGCLGQFDQPVTLTRLGTVRGVALAQLTFSPVRPVADHLRVTTSVQVVLKFNATDLSGFSKIGREVSLDPLLTILGRSVINPQQIRSAPLPFVPVSPVIAEQTGLPRAILSVVQPGLTAISYADLTAIGFPLAGVDPQFLRLSRAGREIAMQWDGNGNALFDADERLLFYADPRFSRWTNTDTYSLSVGDQPGLRMTSRSANSDPQPHGNAWLTQTVEINALYTPTCYCGAIPAGRDGDRWTWDDVRSPDRGSSAYPFGPLPGLDATQPATLTLWLIGYTDLPSIAPDHRVDVSINGVGLGRVEWDGRQAITATFAVASGVLSAADNLLTLNLPGVVSIVEGMWLDGFALTYARSSLPAGSSVLFTGEGTPRTYTLGLTSTVGLRGYDVTDPQSPVRLLGLGPDPITVSDGVGGGHRYFLAAEEAIRSPVAMRLAKALPPVIGADYLIISPSLFVPALADLIALRRSQGMEVAVADLQAIYDAFDGRPTPDAIHAYLQQAYTTWSPRPAYLLLVGDGTFDPKGYRPDSNPTWLPPYLADVDPWMGETAADNRYALLDGDGDRLPDLLVGRLPVNTISETQIVVAKIVGYETDPSPGGWNGNMVFVAGAGDEAGDFAAHAQKLASAFIQPPFTARPIYFAPPVTPVADTQQAIRAGWNAGAGLLLYDGHASVRQWDAARLFHRDDVAALSNAGRLPVVLEMTCFTGMFHEAGGTTLDESLLRAAGGGAVAVWGATGLGVSTGHQQLAAGFLASVLQGQGGTVGAGTLSGRLALLSSGSSALDLLDTFTLLGDPATRLNLILVPWAHTGYLPIVQR